MSLQSIRLTFNDTDVKGRISDNSEAILDVLIRDDPVAALDIIGDWRNFLEAKYADAFARVYPALASADPMA